MNSPCVEGTQLPQCTNIIPVGWSLGSGSCYLYLPAIMVTCCDTQGMVDILSGL